MRDPTGRPACDENLLLLSESSTMFRLLFESITFTGTIDEAGESFKIIFCD